MKKTNTGFSLIELLVVISILAIISVVAYVNFGWATDKAYTSRKMSDLTTIEKALQMYKIDNNRYPMPMASGATNLWWFSWWVNALSGNTLTVTVDGNTPVSIQSAWGGWEVKGSWWVVVVWHKWVFGVWGDGLERKYLSKDLYDPELWDTKVGTGKMIDYGIGRYVYGVYVPSYSAYNLATAFKESDSDTYRAYIVGDYDKSWCSTPADCPDTLIGGDWLYGSIKDGDTATLPYKPSTFETTPATP